MPIPVLEWLMWLVIFGNQWASEGFVYQLDGPYRGEFVRCLPDAPSDVKCERRIILASRAPSRPSSTQAGLPTR